MNVITAELIAAKDSILKILIFELIKRASHIPANSSITIDFWSFSTKPLVAKWQIAIDEVNIINKIEKLLCI